MIVGSLLAPWIAPHDPFDPASLNLLDATDPPVWLDGGTWSFPLGTDDQGRDILSSILYGTRLSLAVGFAAVFVAMTLGVTLGLVAGWCGGFVDTIIMRVADVQLSFPAILLALLIDGVGRGVLPRSARAQLASFVVIAAIALSSWVQYSRTIRAATMVERDKEYILAARMIGVHPITDTADPSFAECRRSGAGRSHHQSRARHSDRSNFVVSGRRPAADAAIPGHLDPKWK
jgi:peptide/nickel transport system permease protein